MKKQEYATPNSLDRLIPPTLSGTPYTPVNNTNHSPTTPTSSTKSFNKRYIFALDGVQDGRFASQKDWDKIVFSSAFRRLTGKTQVFPLVKNDSVHTRGSHSLEVSSVGSTLGREAAELKPIILDDVKLVHDSDYVSSIATYVGAACLLHDIGNPPFGHSGEDALREWWRDWSSLILKSWSSTDSSLPWHLLQPGDMKLKAFQDFEQFEGNAFGYRIIYSRLDGLTFPTQCAYMKYPRPAFVKQLFDSPYKKNGIFVADLLHYVVAANCGGMKPFEDKMFCWTRSPLTYLMEAADDICYNIVDIEDACRMGIVSVEKAISVLEKVIETTSYLIQDHKISQQGLQHQLLQKEQSSDDGLLHVTKNLLHSEFDNDIDDNQKVIEEEFEEETKEDKRHESTPINNVLRLRALRANAISILVNLASIRFANRMIDQRLTNQAMGAKAEPLLNIWEWYPEVKELSLFIYEHPSVIEIEVAGYTVIKDLMNKFVDSCLRCIQKNEKNGGWCLGKKGGTSFYKAFQLLPVEVRDEIRKRVEEASETVNSTVKWMADFNIHTMNQFWEHVKGFKDREKMTFDPVVVILQLDLVGQEEQQQQVTGQEIGGEKEKSSSHEKLLSLYLIYYIVLEISSYVSGMTDNYASELYQKFRGQFL